MTPNFKKLRPLPVTLSRTLGIWEVTLLGVGALLGGGIFTLLGHAAGLAGGGLIFAIIIGAFVAFLNLNSYVSLATTFPQAGGGYNWVRSGLGDLQGFLSGWFSWMASSVACSLYAVSFGIFASELAFAVLGAPLAGISPENWRLFFTVAIILIFGFINYRGVALFGKIGGWISISILVVLAAYIIFGFKKIIAFPEIAVSNFTPLFPLGAVGVMQAAALFYIAFEGSEIQAQTGEEAKNPSRTLKIGLFSSWAIISLIYLLISFVIIGATDSSGVPSWKILEKESERAIIESAKQFLPFGYVLMIVGGILANVAALNATVFSSSRVLFAMARDKFVWSRLGEMHSVNKTPYRAVILSLAIIVFISLLLPLKDIAGAADVLFIALFSQLNLAYIQLRREKPEAKWHYITPFGPLLPLLAISLYIVLGISIFKVSPSAVYFTALWFLLGLVNYFSYTKTAEREEMERGIIYERSARFREKSGYRVVFPVAAEENLEEFLIPALAMARGEQGEITALKIHEVPFSLPLDAGFHTDHERKILEEIEGAARKTKLNVDTRLIAARNIPDAILETAELEDGDLLVMGWDGYVNTKGFIFGRKVDVVLHRIKCDLLIIKPSRRNGAAAEPKKGGAGGTCAGVKKIFIAIPPDENPNLRFVGKAAAALAKWHGAAITMGMVVPEQAFNLEYARYFSLLEKRAAELKLKTAEKPEFKLINSSHITSALLREAELYDLVILPAARGRITKAIGVGSVPEQIAKHCPGTVIIAKGHRGIIQPFFAYLRSRF